MSRFAAIVGAAMTVLCGVADAASPRYRHIDLHAEIGTRETRTVAIASDGTVLIAADVPDLGGPCRTFVWTPTSDGRGRAVELRLPAPLGPSYPLDVNARGQVLLRAGPPDKGDRGGVADALHLWTPREPGSADGAVRAVTSTPPIYTASLYGAAATLLDDGSVIAEAGDRYVYRWRPEGTTPLVDAETQQPLRDLYAVAHDGSVVVRYNDCAVPTGPDVARVHDLTAPVADRWPGGPPTNALSVRSAGRAGLYVVAVFDEGSEYLVRLDDPLADSPRADVRSIRRPGLRPGGVNAKSVNASGVVVGTLSPGLSDLPRILLFLDAPPDAFVWMPEHGMFDLSRCADGWPADVDVETMDVNDAGQIAGWANAWVWVGRPAWTCPSLPVPPFGVTPRVRLPRPARYESRERAFLLLPIVAEGDAR